MKGRILKAAVGAAVSISILAACNPPAAGPYDPPGCAVSGSTATCGWGFIYQNAAGRPIVWVRYQRQGETFFRETPKINCNDYTTQDGVCRVSAYSPTGFLSVNEQSGNS